MPWDETGSPRATQTNNEEARPRQQAFYSLPPGENSRSLLPYSFRALQFPPQSNNFLNDSSPEVFSMAYVDHAFSISDEDIMMETSYPVNNRPPVKEIALAVGLLFFGLVSIVFGIFMAYNRNGGDRTHGIFFTILGSILFIPGFFYTRVAYYAYKGYKGFSFSNIPAL